MKDFKKIIVAILLVLMISGPILATPQKAQAFSPGVVAINAAKWVWEKVEKVYAWVQKKVGVELVNQTVRMFANNLAYDMAKELAEGGPGGKPQFRTLSMQDHLTKAWQSAAGEFIGELSSKHFSDLGLNLCDPRASVKLSLTLALIDDRKPPKPKCNWKDIEKNWNKFGENWKNEALLATLNTKGGSKNLKDFFKSIKAGGDVTVLTKLDKEMKRREAEAKEVAKMEAEECKGYSDKKKTVSDLVVAHCSKVKGLDKTAQEFFENIDKDRKKSEPKVQTLGSIIKEAGMTFVNSFAAKMMKQWFKQGTWSLFKEEENYREKLLRDLRGDADIFQPRNVDIFKSLKTTEISKMADYNMLQDFALCPPDPDFRKPNNCVINTEFLNAALAGKTINQAIIEGLIDPNVSLISPKDRARDFSDDCYKESLCYSNLVKLRQANVIPVGWELAALRSNEVTPVTLQQAIDCFEDAPLSDCSYNISNDYTVDGIAHNPFYHLIDVDWVLKSLPAMCEAYVNSSILESPDSDARQKICTDTKFCLRQDDEGNCLGGQYGYCTVSENIWRFEGDICDEGEIYAGCLIFEDNDESNNSYIEGSLDYCTADQAGCKRYSQENIGEDGNYEWLFEDINFDDNDLFLNKDTSECTEDDNGCSEYIVVNNPNGFNHGPNIVPNGNFEIDEDEDEVPDGWSFFGDYLSGVDCYAVNCIDTTTSLTRIFEVVPGAYNLSAYVGEDMVIGLEDCGIDNTCSSANAYGAAGPSSGDWSRLQKTYTVGENTKYIRLNISPGFVDNIQLQMVNDEDTDANNFSEYGSGGIVYMGGDRVMCEAEEVGCQGYIPTNGGPMIPAVIDDNDLCPVECVGYSTFAEQPSLFDIIEGDTDVKYNDFIPNTAQSCPVQEVGCEEFTNLDEVEQGGETREYYTYLRQCVLEHLGKTYYTWEGSDTAGYQIRTWNALPSNENNNIPCTNLLPDGDECQDTSATIAYCGDNTSDYSDDPGVNSNCREFFSVSGESEFILQDRVIFATNNCHDYRRTKTGSIFQATPIDSISCSADNNGCLSYYGNAANNLRQVFSDNFENDNYDPWEGTVDLELSTEALNNNGHSLNFHSGNNVIISRSLANNIQDYKEYELSWWMKNNSFLSDVEVYLYFKRFNGEVIVDDTVPISTDSDTSLVNIEAGNWHNYKISEYIDTLTELGVLMDTMSLRLEFDGIQDQIYIDNIVLKEVTNSISVIENTWNTPLSCDHPYVGYHLGCQSYVDLNNNQYNLKSFNRLCREDSIGCSLVIDTHNSTYPFEQIFNAEDYSEVTVPVDSVDYLVPDMSKYCSPMFKGCMALGTPVIAREYENIETKYIINDPDAYESIMCNADGLWCEEYSSAKGTYYFKDPGNETCTYQKDVLIGNELITGWFDSQSLQNGNAIGCDDNYELPLGQAAVCPSTKNLCNAYRDPSDPIDCDPEESDPDANHYCKTYYYYDNDRIDEESCNGQVDKNSGCILLYDTNNWNGEHSQIMSYYDTEQTYDENVEEGIPVSPVVCDPYFDTNCNLDSNLLIKVRKDRQCSEWLACKSSSSVWDRENNKEITICDEIDTCLEYNYNNNITNCKRWRSAEEEINVLTTEEYQKRTSGEDNHLAWEDKEYLGYSIPNYLPIGELVPFNFGDNDNPPRLSYGYGNLSDDQGRYYSGCRENDGDDCDPAIPFQSGNQFYGECREGLCWVNPVIDDDSDSSFGLSTRGYAVGNSPFPTGIAPEGSRLQAYSGANICEDGGDNNCESEYYRVTYGQGGVIKYYSKENDAISLGICISGKEGDECNSNRRCDTNDGDMDGVCNLISKKETFVNWPGICLEEDMTSILPDDTEGGRGYCDQWYPVTHISGTNSLYNMYTEAGYYNPDGIDSLFCTVSEPYLVPEDRIYCGRFDGDNCNVLIRVPKGSEINVDVAEENLYLLTEDIDNPNWLVAEEFTYEDDLIEGDPIEPIIYNSTHNKFTRYEFGNITGSNFMGTIEALFDASEVGGLRMFYYDEGVSADGSTVGRHTKIFLDDGTNEDHSYSHVRRECRDGLCDNEECAQDIASGQGVNYCEDHGMHLVDWSCWDKWYWWCSGSDLHDKCRIYCNPKTHNYYVSKFYTSGGGPLNNLTSNCVENCIFTSEFDFDTNHGRGCLHNGNKTIKYLDLYTSSIINGLYSETECLGLDGEDADDCAYISCIEELQIGDNNDVNEDHACSEYESCQDYLVDGNTGGVLISDDMLTDVNNCFGDDSEQEDENGPKQNYDGHFPCIYIEGETYSQELAGEECTDLACMQQCKIVSVLDSDGDDSWVRTDIWWRNEDTGSRVNMAWLSFYYDAYSNNYIQNNYVDYNGINYENVEFTHFGSSLTNSRNQAVVTRVPLDESLSDTQAYTFFSHTIEQDAYDQLKYLFARVYNLLWDSASNRYNPNYPNLYIHLNTPGFNPNNHAGPDYNPRVLGVCNIPGTGTLTTCKDDYGNAIQGITLNNQNDVEVSGHEVLFIAAKFYYYAHPDHMPIMDIGIDWSDGSGLINSPGKYKNNIPECNSEEDMPSIAGEISGQGFGGLERACREGYKLMYHDYYYDTNYLCSNTEGAPDYDNASCYKPEVVISDRWGNSTTQAYGDWIVIYEE